MTEQPKPTKRIRANISTSVKGQRTFDATVEYMDCPIDQEGATLEVNLLWQKAVLAELDALVAALTERCPQLG
jgi:hypothetical protein